MNLNPSEKTTVSIFTLLLGLISLPACSPHPLNHSQESVQYSDPLRLRLPVLLPQSAIQVQLPHELPRDQVLRRDSKIQKEPVKRIQMTQNSNGDSIWEVPSIGVFNLTQTPSLQPDPYTTLYTTGRYQIAVVDLGTEKTGRYRYSSRAQVTVTQDGHTVHSEELQSTQVAFAVSENQVIRNPLRASLELNGDTRFLDSKKFIFSEGDIHSFCVKSLEIIQGSAHLSPFAKSLESPDNLRRLDCRTLPGLHRDQSEFQLELKSLK